MAQLPPISSEIFTEKVLATKAADAATVAKASFERYCDACHRQYFSENAYNNHLGSQKHKANMIKERQSPRPRDPTEVVSVMSSTFSLDGSGNPKEEEGIDNDAEEEFHKVVKGIKDASLDDDEDPVSRRPSRPHASAASQDVVKNPLSSTPSSNEASGELSEELATRLCLFCNKHFTDLASNVRHMEKAHGLFIPERNYLIDLKGLVFHLSRIVHDEYRCLYCNRLKWTEDGIKTHMRDSGHCKIAYDTDEQKLEIGDHYDFRSTYSDMGDEDVIMDDGQNHDSPKEDDGWETSSTVSSVPTEELGKMYYDGDKEGRSERLKTHRHHSHSNHGKHHAADGFHSHAHHTVYTVYHDEVELHLPTGRVAGHRSMNKYWRQNLRSYPTAEERHQRLLEYAERMDVDNSDVRGRQSDTRIARSDRGLGMLAVSESKKREVQALEKREKRREHRDQTKVQWSLNKQSNHQKHFRDPLLQ
jgi:pre-60S factor REI1